MNKHQLLEELKRNPKNVRFEQLCKTAEIFGFTFRGGKVKQTLSGETVYKDCRRLQPSRGG